MALRGGSCLLALCLAFLTVAALRDTAPVAFVGSPWSDDNFDRTAWRQGVATTGAWSGSPSQVARTGVVVLAEQSFAAAAVAAVLGFIYGLLSGLQVAEARPWPVVRGWPRTESDGDGGAAGGRKRGSSGVQEAWWPRWFAGPEKETAERRRSRSWSGAAEQISEVEEIVN